MQSQRCKWAPRIVRQQIASLNRCERIVKSCNDFFSTKIKLLLIGYLSVTLAYLYGIRYSDSFADSFIIAYVVVYCIFCTAFFFISASLFKNQVFSCYRTFHRFQSRNLPLRLQWQVMLITEFLGSRKKRVGFQLKNWCNLNNFVLLKVIIY